MNKDDLTPAQLSAILIHKYFLSRDMGREVTLDEAIFDFLQRYATNWISEKHLQDNRAQRERIDEYHQKCLAEGRTLSREAAAHEWISNFAAVWRNDHESLEKNGFLQMMVVVRNPRGIHLRPTSILAHIAQEYDTDVHVHKPNMPHFDYVLLGKPYVNVKSPIYMLSLGIRLGDMLELLAKGAQARECLDALAEEINREADAEIERSGG